jgi:biopolymer transport protein ExbB
MKIKAKDLDIPIWGSGTSKARRCSQVCPAWIPALVLCFLLPAAVGVGQADSQNDNAVTGVTPTPTLSVTDGGILSQTDPGATLAEVARPEWFSLAWLKSRFDQTSLIHIFKKGGLIMWPLMLASILALGTVIERVFFLFIEQLRRDTKAVKQFFEAIAQGDTQGAIGIGNASKFYVVRVLGYALSHKEKSLATALLFAQEQEMIRFRRGIPILDTVITLAPLLGLLGTVTGMMGSFSLIGGELSAPGAITGGIAEALIATAFGLGIAITSLIPFNYLNTRMEKANLEMETAATQLEMALHPQVHLAGVIPAAPAGPSVVEIYARAV